MYSSQSISESEPSDTTQIKRLPAHLNKTKCSDDKAFKAKRKREALELAEITYDLFIEEGRSGIIKEGYNNA